MSKFFVMLFVIVSFVFFASKANAEVDIVVDISDQTMYVETPLDAYEWPVSTGRTGHRTPTGVFQPYMMKKMHYSSKYENAPMPNSIFFYGGYAIHATNAVNRLGSPASHGCVRLHPQNAKWLFRMIQEYGKENTFIYIQD